MLEAPGSDSDTTGLEHSLFTHPDDTSFIDGLDDPIRTLAALQDLGPIVRGEALNGGTMLRFGDFIVPNLMSPPSAARIGSFAATTWEAAQKVYADSKTFSSSANSQGSGKNWGRNISEMDPPEHTAYRTAMQRGFVPRLVTEWEKTIILPVMSKWFARISGRGRADLVRDLNVYFPYEIVGTIAGFDPAGIGFVADAFHKMHQAFLHPAAATQASIDLKRYAGELVDARRGAPKSDVVSALVQSEVNGEPIDQETLVGMTIHLLQGGIDTVFRMSSNLVHLLLDHPDQFEKVKQDPSLIPALIEEGLRYEGVASMMSRLVMHDTNLMGVDMPAGSLVFLLHPVVNRDPARWDDPHRFDIERPRRAHMAFGYGAHSCIGMHLARFELAKYVEFLISELPNLRWDPDAPERPRVTGWLIRGSNNAPVVWDVA